MMSSNKNIRRVTGLCAGISPVTSEFPTQRLVTRRFDVFFDMRRNKRLSKQIGTLVIWNAIVLIWRHCNVW